MRDNGNPLLVANNDPTRLATQDDIRRLKEDCDDVTTYQECGWFCAVGWKGTNRLVHVHFYDEDHFMRSMYPQRMREKHNEEMRRRVERGELPLSFYPRFSA